MSNTKFCIITTARSGSNALVSLLSLMPDTICHGELFSHTGVWLARKPPLDLPRSVSERNLDPLAFLRLVEDETSRHAALCGFKLFIGQNRVVLNHVIRSVEYRVVLLSRQNSLAQFASLQVARASGLWQSRRKPAQRAAAPAIRFEMAEFDKFARSLRWQYKKVKTRLEARQHPYFPLEYKQLKNAAVIDALGEFMGGAGAGPLSQLIPSIPEVKQGPVAITERFSNPEEVVAAMRELGHEDWLVEEDQHSHV
jgi:LPS sulfotransferase NodH